MNDINKLFKDIKKMFTIRKRVDFAEYGVHIELTTTSAAEEMRVLEACAKLEGAMYLEGLKRFSLAYAIKKINGINIDMEEIEYEDDKGEKKMLSKYLFMIRRIEEWPLVLRDKIFEAYANLQEELEDKVKQDARFEKYISPVKEEDLEEEEETDAPEGFKKVKEPVIDPTESLTAVEKDGLKAKEEIEKAQEVINKQA